MFDSAVFPRNFSTVQIFNFNLPQDFFPIFFTLKIKYKTWK